jgi:hypothetical protein
MTQQYQPCCPLMQSALTILFIDGFREVLLRETT